MTDCFVRIRGIDPLLFRDGRPFGDELGSLSAQTLPLPLPGTLAGFARTRLGDSAGWDWATDGPEKAQQVPVAGPLLLRTRVEDEAEILFAAPADALVFEDINTLRVMTLRPKQEDDTKSGCNLPSGLSPLDVTEDIKPASGYTYWPWSVQKQWLLSPTGEPFDAPENIVGPLREDRTHVAIQQDTGAAEEGKLFSTRSLCFEQHPRWGQQEKGQEWALMARIDYDTDITGGGPFGGERRLAAAETAVSTVWPQCSDELRQAIGRGRYIRLQLATPGLFRSGWRPDWFDDPETLSTDLAGFKFRLVSAAVRRREPVSGWDYRIRSRGPKAVRWAVPAGSVYFLEVIEGDTGLLAERFWLNPVSDDPQDRHDGYGLALWGIWNWSNKETIE